MKLRVEDVERLLKDWNGLNRALGSLNEKQVAVLLDVERRGAARRYVLKRLHQRFNVLRARRERAELLR
jgi:hypothetical protein